MKVDEPGQDYCTLFLKKGDNHKVLKYACCEKAGALTWKYI